MGGHVKRVREQRHVGCETRHNTPSPFLLLSRRGASQCPWSVHVSHQVNGHCISANSSGPGDAHPRFHCAPVKHATPRQALRCKLACLLAQILQLSLGNGVLVRPEAHIYFFCVAFRPHGLHTATSSQDLVIHKHHARSCARTLYASVQICPHKPLEWN